MATREDKNHDERNHSAEHAGGGAVSKSDKRDQKNDQSDRQIDDNQDDLGRDVNDPGKTANDINKV